MKPSGRMVSNETFVDTNVKLGKMPRVAPWRPIERTEFLVYAVGGKTQLAKTLGVSAAQPGRWISGEDVPSADVAGRLLDLDHVLALAAQAWSPDLIWGWMTSPNAFLDGAEPVKVLRERGSAEVIDALKATLSGAYA